MYFVWLENSWAISLVHAFAIMSHSWENRPRDQDHHHQWENRDLDWDDGDRSDSDLEGDRQNTPGEDFENFLVDLFIHSAISANIFSQIMWFASEAGIKEAAKYGMKPGQHTSNYSKKIKTALGWYDRADFYHLDLPGHSKHDLERSTQKCLVIPGFEQMQEDLENSATDRELWRERLRSPGGLPPSYYSHPVVQGAGGELVWPIAIYLDGVPYSLTDSVIGFWVHNLISGMRYLIGIIRKRNICQCGCRGWCTIWSNCSR